MRCDTFYYDDLSGLEAGLKGIAYEDEPQGTLLVEMFGVSLSEEMFCRAAGLIRERFPAAKVVGGPTDAFIAGGRAYSWGLTVCFIRFSIAEASMRSLPLEDGTIQESGCLEWLEGLDDLVVLQVLATSSLRETHGLFQGRLRWPVFGGILNSEPSLQQGFIYAEGEVFAKGLLVLAFCGKGLEVRVGSYSGWHGMGRLLKVTALDGPYVLKELDGQPFGEVYRHYLGDYAKEDSLELMPPAFPGSGHEK